MKRKKWIVILCVLLAVLAAALFIERDLVRMIFYSNYDPQNKLDVENWQGGTAYMGVRYADVSENDYINLYVPDGDAPAPLIVAVHGGGFVMNDCESRQAQLFYQYFRDHGYACATVNYRLADEAKFPGAVQDVKAAVRFLKANAETYGYDADRVAIWGESAGGYLAVMAGVTTDDEFNDLPFIGEDQLDAPVSAKVDVVLDYYGAVKLESQADRNAAFKELGVPGFVVSIANNWLADAIKDTPEYETCEDAWMGKRFDQLTDAERQAVQPLYYAGKNLGADSDLDVLIWHGDADITVPWTQSRALYDLLCEKLGEDRVTFEIFRNCKHADENMYSDETLGRLKTYLDGVMG